jgi:soluble lytic murein transglycosylase-like protein
MPALPEADCDALDSTTVDSLIAAAAKKQSLEPSLLHAVMKQESAFKPCAVSIKGAQGLMQLMPATAQQLHVSDPFDPEQNVQGGAAFLKQLLARYKGDLRLALMAYNAGTLRADQKDKDSVPAETQNYIAGIFAELGISRAEPPAEPPAEPEDPPVAPEKP